MKTLPLNALRAFAHVHAHGGVRAAARELGIAHSSVSRHLAELEAWLGVGLTREAGGGARRRLAFTPQGEALGKAVSAGLRDIARAAGAIREARSGNTVTLAAAPSVAARWLLPRLPILEAAYPRIELSIVVEQRMVDPAESNVDIAIRMGRGPWPDVHCEPLMDDALYPVMSPRYWERAGKPDSAAELVRLKLLHDRDPNAAWEIWRNAHGPAKLDVRRGPRFASTDLLLRAAGQSQGVALARHRLAAEDIETGRLIRPLGKLHVEVKNAYWLVLPEHPQPRPAVKLVLDWLRAQARD